MYMIDELTADERNFLEKYRNLNERDKENLKDYIADQWVNSMVDEKTAELRWHPC